MTEYEPFTKIARLRRDIVITEKLDGTNASILIDAASGDPRIMGVGSRTRWITPEDDNYGFARWVKANNDELLKLGDGQHFGEWWGGGIQRKYGLSEKRFSLFNTYRWSDPEVRPKCCHVVPVLGSSTTFDMALVDACVETLRKEGSRAAPGFMKPEGVIVFHAASKQLFKQTLEKDDKHKGEA